MTTEVPTVLVRMSPELVTGLEAGGWRFGRPDTDGFYEPSITGWNLRALEECPSCDDASAAHQAGFHEVWRPDSDLEEVRGLLEEVLWRAEAAQKEGVDEFHWPFIEETRTALTHLRERHAAPSLNEAPRPPEVSDE